jgi:hypothetical protein
MQPRGQQRSPFEAAEAPERAQERFLNGVAGVLLMTEQATGHREQASTVGANQVLERGVVPGPEAGHQLGLGAEGRPGFS